jgi:DNA-binding transcriptional MerR regulator
VVSLDIEGKDCAVNEFFTVSSVARRIGVAPATLRTWDLRYGLGPSHHEPGTHRRYSPKDLARLTLMRNLICSGVSASEAAQSALSSKVSLASIKSEPSSGIAPTDDDHVNALYRSAKSLDSALLESALKKLIQEFGVVDAWQSVIAPLLHKVGLRWADTGDEIEVEHLLSEVLKKVLHTPAISKPVNSRPVVLACVGEEHHSLALHALAAALAERKIESYFLGSRTPLEALCQVVKRSAPPAIFLWAQLPENGEVKYFQSIPKVRPAPRIVLGGPGWSRDECSSVTFADDLSTACEEISRAVGV